MGNTFKTALLLTALTLFLLFMGQIFGGQRGLVMAFGLAIIMNFVSYFWSDKIALKMYRAQPVTREQLPRAYAVVERLTQKMGIPMPKMYVIPNGVTERLRDRTQSPARFRRRYRRHPEPAERRRAGRRAGARAGPRAQP